jgi:hypothetical protein
LLFGEYGDRGKERLMSSLSAYIKGVNGQIKTK